MSNDRVRIYDLAKELNLENKELVAICDQLNIAAKSHSSSISETDTERIRAVAAKYATVRTSSGEESAATSPKTHSQMTTKAQAKPSPTHKQQILEIRKPKAPERTNLQESQVAAHSPESSVPSPIAPQPYAPSVSPIEPTAPVRPVVSTNQPETTLVKPDADSTPQVNERSPIAKEAKAVPERSQLVKPPARPVSPVVPTSGPSQVARPTRKRDQVKPTPNASIETGAETATEHRTEVSSTSEQVTPRVQPGSEVQRPKVARSVEPETPTVAKSAEPTVVAAELKAEEKEHSEIAIAPKAKAVPERSQLVNPPVRPVSPVAPTSAPSQVERPTQKRDRSNQPVETAMETTVEKPVRRPKVASGLEQETAKAPAMPELQRPKVARLVKPEAPLVGRSPKPVVLKGDAKVGDEGVERGALLGEPQELLERPTLPRPVKAGKKWHQEESDEEQEAAAKAGKAGAKVKRLKPLTDVDDEEAWDDTDLDLDAPIQLSLAVARPARQKVSVVKSPVTAAIKSKKAGSSRDRNQQRLSEAARSLAEPKLERPEKLVVTGSMTVQELANALAVQDTEIVKLLFVKGMAVNITQNLEIPTITWVASQLGVQIETAEPEAQARKVTEMVDAQDLENLQWRPPVVTIMGHVDHGKTTLLDAIRHTKVAQGEAGGITQHIGAYHVDVEHNGKVQQVVFLDTPGHEAFTAMRARGARVTDIAILVVAADDGVRPQTIEAISHAKAAEVPIIVAINKVDKPEAQPERVMQELTEYGLVAEEWGGDTIMVPVSAIQQENLDTLLEMILLVAEVSDLQANPDRSAKGTVIEANLDKTRGPVATLLVQNGTLRVGDVLVAGSVLGKVRAMVDDTGRRVEAATPSFAVAVLGLSDVPAAGDEFEVFQNEKEARAIATEKADKQRQSRLMQGRVTLTTLSAQAQEGKLKELNLILKVDVQGSVEAIVGALKQLPQNEVQIHLLLAAPGEITETDIDLAAASNAVIVGFNTTITSGARQSADEAGVDVREYNIIYKLLEDIQGALEGLLEPELVEEALGQSEVRAVFKVGRSAVAGCYVQSGKMLRNSKARVRRGGKVIYEGTLDSLKRMKEDAREVNAGYECGIGIDKFNDWAEGDIIEAFQMVTKRRTLSMIK